MYYWNIFILIDNIFPVYIYNLAESIWQFVWPINEWDYSDLKLDNQQWYND